MSALQDPELAGTLGLEVTGFVGGLVVLVLSFCLCRGLVKPDCTKRTFYGLRWSIVFFVLATLLRILTIAIEATDSPLEAPAILEVFSVVFFVAAQPVLVYTIVKTIYHPLRAAGVARRDTAAALSLSALVAAAAGAVVGTEAAYEAGWIMEESSSGYYYGDGDGNLLTTIRILDLVNLIFNIISVLVGLVILPMAIYALRKRRGLQVDPLQRPMSRIMVAVAVISLGQSIVVLGLEVVLANPELVSHTPVEDAVELGIADNAISIVLSLVIYSLLIAVFRQKQFRGGAYPEQQPYYGEPPYYSGPPGYNRVPQMQAGFSPEYDKNYQIQTHAAQMEPADSGPGAYQFPASQQYQYVPGIEAGYPAQARY